MNLKTILALLCPLLVVSCGKESPAIHQEGQDDREVSFFGSIGPSTRATDSNFETGDAIGVFAIEKTSSNPNGDIQTSNHADNVKYSYSNGSFKGASTVIKQITFQRLMFYKAVYPYTSSARNEFTFSVKTNQSYSDYYTLSDLMTAEAGPTSAVTPQLTFTHRLCDVLVSVCYEEKPTGTAHLYFNNVKTSVKVNLNEDTFVTGNAAGNVKAKPYGTNGFRLVLPSQVIKKGSKLITLNIGSSSYSVTTDEYITLRPEIQHTFRLVVRKDGKATLTTSENPWKSDIGIEDIVPKEMLRGIKEHMPIYVGNTPPDVEGSYYINPFVSSYYSDLDKNPENSLTSETINFSDQIDGTLTVNTLTDGSDTYYYLEGAYITGYGNYFTVFYDYLGSLDAKDGTEIPIRRVEIYSGKKTSTGISNMYYANAFVEKGDDPYGEYMEEGTYRIFKDKDGLSEKSSWAPASSSSAPETRANIFNPWKGMESGMLKK
mgnify:FL=1